MGVNAKPWHYYLQERDPVPIVLDEHRVSGPKRCISKLSLILALENFGYQCHAPALLTPRKRLGTHRIGRLMGLWTKRWTSILSLSWALEQVDDQCHAQALLTPRKRLGTQRIGRSMGLWTEAVYHISFFMLGARTGGWSMPSPGPFTSKKENRYPLCWMHKGHLGRSFVPLNFP